jgi:hypothetical protein
MTLPPVATGADSGSRELWGSIPALSNAAAAACNKVKCLEGERWATEPATAGCGAGEGNEIKEE